MHHLPERDRPPIKARMRKAWRETDYPRALEQLQRLADELEHTHPGAAGSLREGMAETLTVIRLGIKGKLRRTLESTNPCESMIDTVRTTQRNVKHWSSGEMGMRGPPPGCSKPRNSSAGSSATPTYPASPSRSNADSTFPSPTPSRPRRPRSQSLCNDHTGTVATEVPRRTGQRPPSRADQDRGLGRYSDRRFFGLLVVFGGVKPGVWGCVCALEGWGVRAGARAYFGPRSGLATGRRRDG
jgi:hypothetical protein